MTVSLSPHVRAPVTTRGIMTDVIVALAPAGAVAAVVFGWQAMALIVSAVVAALAAEYLLCKVFKKPSTLGDGSAIVTGLLIAYNMPANAPWWVAALGSVFAIVLVKQLFGGLGHNFLNPAIVGRAFMMASWPAFMTAFMLPVLGVSGVAAAADTIASATPLAMIDAGNLMYSKMDLFLGVVPGCLGEVSKVALLIGGVYLILRRVIDWRIPAVFLGAFFLLSWAGGDDPVLSVLTGGVVLGAFFMLTDYVTSPATRWGRVIFALAAALIVFVIRKFSGAYPEGMSYAILFVNVLTPLIERITHPKVYGEVARHG